MEALLHIAKFTECVTEVTESIIILELNIKELIYGRHNNYV